MITLIVVWVGAISSAQADGWYFSESFGGAQVDDQLGEYFDSGAVLRGAVGRRIGSMAIEAFAMVNLLGEDRSVPGGTRGELSGYGLSAKYMFPLSERIEFYLRGGLHKTQLWSGVDGDSRGAYRGRGIHYGAGIQLKGKVRALGFLFTPLFFSGVGPKVTAALFVETGGQFTRLHDDERYSLDADIKGISVGFAIGSGF